MASQSSNNSLPIGAVFGNLFRNLPRLMLTNLLFAVPLGAFFALFWYLSTLLPSGSIQSMLVMFCFIIPVFPFYAGVVRVTSKIAAEEEKVPVFGNFFRAVRDNFFRFLAHGIVMYVIVVFSYISFNLYLKLIAENTMFVGPLIITSLVILFCVFMFFYVPVMTVTFDIPMRYIYKNSFLMSYGELKKNFIGLLGVLLLLVISTTFLIACQGSRLAVVIVTIVLLALFVPAIATFIIHSAVYKRMYAMITDKSQQAQAVNKKLAEQKKPTAEESREQLMQALLDFEVDESLPDDEYLYFNGKMMKKSVIMKLKREAQEKAGESDAQQL